MMGVFVHVCMYIASARPNEKTKTKYHDLTLLHSVSPQSIPFIKVNIYIFTKPPFLSPSPADLPPPLTSKHLRPRHRIRRRIISIIPHTSISLLVRPGKRDQPGRRCRPRPSDLQLMAPGVELSSRVRTRRVQGDNLVAHEVVPRLEARGNGVSGCAAGRHELRGAPGGGCAGAALFFDFEPHGAAGEKC